MWDTVVNIVVCPVIRNFKLSGNRGYKGLQGVKRGYKGCCGLQESQGIETGYKQGAGGGGGERGLKVSETIPRMPTWIFQSTKG